MPKFSEKRKNRFNHRCEGRQGQDSIVRRFIESYRREA